MMRRLQLLLIAGILLIAAFSTGLTFLFYLVYLAILVIGGSYIVTRLGLSDLEAGYAVSQLNGHVGDRIRVTYTLRNTSRIPKPWLEVHNPTTLPGGLPGRAIPLGPKGERSWLVRVPLVRRGHFRIEPLQIRTGDPFGFFEASATVGQGVAVVVYPRIEPLPLFKVPAAYLEGSHAAPERTLQTIRLATSVTDKALAENRAVGITINAHRLTILPADRGGRQRLKILQLLAAVEADGSTPLAEPLVQSVGRLRRGMTAVVVTASQDGAFIRPLAGLRGRGISTVVILLDP